MASYDLKFSKPGKTDILKRLNFVAKREGMNIDIQAVEQIVEVSGNDIR